MMTSRSLSHLVTLSMLLVGLAATGCQKKAFSFDVVSLSCDPMSNAKLTLEVTVEGDDVLVSFRHLRHLDRDRPTFEAHLEGGAVVVEVSSARGRLPSTTLRAPSGRRESPPIIPCGYSGVLRLRDLPPEVTTIRVGDVEASIPR